uniref:ATP synthase F0 subunit 8 n=1 Tax=Kulikovia alborostrata TaxID=187796 RepID=I6MR64_9BILA|nr:ATP synthase F0 subunit 8 [Kulikovia alborostrata]AEM23542.1 ATP synthase F0 subunit 8 [Kulikovia alborostrata]
MPQLAPLSWVFLSVLLFFLIFAFCGLVWWWKKSYLGMGSLSEEGVSPLVWCW